MITDMIAPRPPAADVGTVTIAAVEGGRYRLEARQWIPAPLPKVFDFFSDAANLDAITPPWLGFRIVTPTPILMNAGTVIDYRISLHGIRLSWRTVIEAFEPPHRFIDRQVRGPYQLWVHEHRFREDRGGTTIEDSVTYAPPLRPLGLAWLAQVCFVRHQLLRIFGYRQRALASLFGGSLEREHEPTDIAR